MKKKSILFTLGVSIILFSCSLKQSLTEQYSGFITGFPQVNYPIVIDSAVYVNMMRKEFKTIDTFYYSLLYDQDRDTNTVYFYLGKYDMGNNYEGILYSKVKKRSKDTTINIYMMVSTFDSFAYKVPLTRLVKQQDTLYMENLIVHNDEFDIYPTKYINNKLLYKDKQHFKLKQPRKSKSFKIDTLKN